MTPCHLAKTAGRLRYEFGWLKVDTIVFLADVGWVAWGEDGEPYGPGWRHFAALPPRIRDGLSGTGALPVLAR